MWINQTANYSIRIKNIWSVNYTLIPFSSCVQWTKWKIRMFIYKYSFLLVKCYKLKIYTTRIRAFTLSHSWNNNFHIGLFSLNITSTQCIIVTYIHTYKQRKPDTHSYAPNGFYDPTTLNKSLTVTVNWWSSLSGLWLHLTIEK